MSVTIEASLWVYRSYVNDLAYSADFFHYWGA